jgi:hypothetical protein
VLAHSGAAEGPRVKQLGSYTGDLTSRSGFCALPPAIILIAGGLKLSRSCRRPANRTVATTLRILHNGTPRTKAFGQLKACQPTSISLAVRYTLIQTRQSLERNFDSLISVVVELTAPNRRGLPVQSVTRNPSPVSYVLVSFREDGGQPCGSQ